MVDFRDVFRYNTCCDQARALRRRALPTPSHRAHVGAHDRLRDSAQGAEGARSGVSLTPQQKVRRTGRARALVPHTGQGAPRRGSWPYHALSAVRRWRGAVSAAAAVLWRPLLPCVCSHGKSSLVGFVADNARRAPPRARSAVRAQVYATRSAASNVEPGGDGQAAAGHLGRRRRRGARRPAQRRRRRGRVDELDAGACPLAPPHTWAACSFSRAPRALLQSGGCARSGADYASRADTQMQCPAHIVAASKGGMEMVKLLLEHGLKKDAADSVRSRSAVAAASALRCRRPPR